MRSLQYAEVGFDAPRDWLDVSVVTFTRPSGRAAPAVVLTRETANDKLSIDKFARAHLKTLKRSLKKHRLVKEEAVTIDGQAAHRFEHRFLSSERVAVHQLQYFFRTTTDVAVLSMTCAVDEIDEHRPLFESIAQSVRREPNAA